MRQQGKRKIGRNEPCPCGSGIKFKRCHGNVIPPPSPERLQETAADLLARAQAREKQRQDQQGLGRPIITAVIKDTRFIAIGNTLRYSTKWKTVPDFLGDYLRIILGTEWAI